MTEEVEVELDAQSFLSGAPAVVSIFRATLINFINDHLTFLTAEEVEAVLAEVDAVPHHEDVHAYLGAVIPVMTAATTAAVQPRIDALVAASESARAECRRQEEALEKFWREVEEFRRMKTSGIH